MAELIDETIEVDGRRVHQIRGGEWGPEVVLLHGGGTNSAHLCWDPCLLALAAECRVLAPDLPGFGASEPLPECTLENLVEFLRAWLAATGVERPILVAHSMSGLVALRVAAEEDRIGGLVLVDALGLGSRVPWRGLVWLATHSRHFQPAVLGLSRRLPPLLKTGLRYNLATARARNDPDLIAALLNELRRPQAGRAWNEFLEDQAVGGRFRGDDPGLLEALDHPVLLLHGRQDRLVPVSAARQGVERIRRGRLVELDPCGHWPSREQPGRTVAEVVAFARRCAADPGDDQSVP